MRTGADGTDPELIAEILAVLHDRTGVDFTRFRPATVRRRIFNRMISAGSASLPEYAALLRTSDREAPLLLERITIKVSRFYRNHHVFDLLRARVFPRLAGLRRPVRIWSAGCGCGEEPYTLAMLLDESGLEGEVLATDIDPGALDSARRATYARSALAELPATLATRHFAPAPEGRERLVVAPGIRDRVRFRPHDLTSPLPPEGERFDLVSCRMVLIYLER